MGRDKRPKNGGFEMSYLIVNNYDSKPSSENYRTMVVFNIEAKQVEISEFWGNGTPIRQYNGLDVCLASFPGANFADVDGLVALLEGPEAQELLAQIEAGHEIVFDGSNHVGRVTDSAREAEEALEEMLQAEIENLSTYWSAEEWYGSGAIYGELALCEVENHGSIEEAAVNSAVLAPPEVALDEEDLKRYLTRELETLAEDQSDLALCNRARILLDDQVKWPLLTTIRADYDRYDQNHPGGVTLREFELGNLTLTLVDDTQNCWIAETETIEEAMHEVLPAPKRSGDDMIDGLWWYEQLCCTVRHRKDLEAAFEAEFGPRNWP